MKRINYLFNNDNYIMLGEDVNKLYKSIEKGDEFEISFLNLRLNDYINLVKYLIEKKITETTTLDIAYSKGKNMSYRCSIKNNINGYMRMVSQYHNNLIFNILSEMKNDNIELMKKERKNVIDNFDYDIRIRLSHEEKVKTMEKVSYEEGSKISFRYKQRISSYINDNFRVDLTLVLMNKTFNGLNSANPIYELEIEVINKDSNYSDLLEQVNIFLKIIQQSKFLISKTISNEVLNHYFMIVGKTDALVMRQAISMKISDLINILPNNYAVTDKADGERYFLMIHDKNTYLISTNLVVMNVGVKIKDEKYNGSILDGELVLIKDKYIYLAFDCLFNGINDIRKTKSLFDRQKNIDEIIFECYTKTKMEDKYESIGLFMKMIDDDFKTAKNILIRKKYFEGVTGASNTEIFEHASNLWNELTKNSEIKQLYGLDGLIFQPIEQEYTNNKYPDLKWKPPNRNTIDFYIKFERDKYGKIINVFDNSNDEFEKDKLYRICYLYVGTYRNGAEYPILFKEYDKLHMAKLFLKDGEVRDESGNIINDNTVVEFYYDIDSSIMDSSFRWIPVRTRYDKTESVMKYKKKYGNSMKTADKIWESIIHPILMDDIIELSNAKMYNKKIFDLRKRLDGKIETIYQRGEKPASEMRNFMNYIKMNIISLYCNPVYHDNKQISVLDLGVGEGGDILKFYYANVSFVVGIDIDRDRLYSPIVGAVSRYNSLKKKHKNFPRMYFIQADIGKQLDDQEKIFKIDTENLKLLDKFFGNDKMMFDRINCQFAIHYVFKNEIVFSNFKSNINAYLRKGGYMMLSAPDAQVINRLLKKGKFKYSYTNKEGEKKILFEIVKRYPDVDDSIIIGLGNAIDVYMAWYTTEGRYIPEYLVDPRYLISELDKDCDMELIESDSFSNQYETQKEFILNYSQFDLGEKTKDFFKNIGKFYINNEINNGGKLYNDIMRYYIFRKRQIKEEKKGGYLDPKDYTFIKIRDNGHTCLDGIEFIFNKSGIVPKHIKPIEFYNDQKIKYYHDLEINDKILNKLSEIVIKHEDDRNIIKTVIDNLKIHILERDVDNHINDVTFGKSGNNIYMMRDGNLYTPLFKNIDDKLVGILNK